MKRFSSLVSQLHFNLLNMWKSSRFVLLITILILSFSANASIRCEKLLAKVPAQEWQHTPLAFEYYINRAKEYLRKDSSVEELVRVQKVIQVRKEKLAEIYHHVRILYKDDYSLVQRMNVLNKERINIAEQIELLKKQIDELEYYDKYITALFSFLDSYSNDLGRKDYAKLDEKWSYPKATRKIPEPEQTQRRQEYSRRSRSSGTTSSSSETSSPDNTLATYNLATGGGLDSNIATPW